MMAKINQGITPSDLVAVEELAAARTPPVLAADICYHYNPVDDCWCAYQLSLTLPIARRDSETQRWSAL